MKSTFSARLMIFAIAFLFIFLALFLYSNYTEKIPKANVNISKIITEDSQQKPPEGIEPAQQAIPLFIAAGVIFIVVIAIYGILKTIGSRHKKF